MNVTVSEGAETARANSKGHRAILRPLPRKAMWAFVLFLPLLLHLWALASSVTGHRSFEFGRFDFLVLVCAVLYAAFSALALSHRKWALGFGIGVYSALILLGAADALLSLREAKFRSLPRAPMRTVSNPANTMPGVSGEIRYTVNQLGVRGPEMPLDAPATRLLCMGGSGTECLYITDEKSWPWLLGTLLTKAAGRPVLCGNAGASGHIALNHQFLLRHYKYADRFQWVLVMCGANDLDTFLKHGYALRAAEVPFETLGERIERDAPYYHRLALARSLRDFGRSLAPDTPGSRYTLLRAERRRMLATRTMTNLPPDLPDALALYKKDLKGIIRVCGENQQHLVFVTRPCLYQANMKPELAALLWEYTTEGAHSPAVMERLVSAYNDAMKEVCREEGIDCFDLAATLPKDTTVFYDDYHFNIHGCQLVAENLCRFLQNRIQATEARH